MNALSPDKLQLLENFGHSIKRPSYYFEPKDADEIKALFSLSQAEGLSLALRGNGRSYGDASLNGGQIALAFEQMKQVISWDPQKGIIKVQPGMTIGQLWEHILGDGWWPPVVPGTMTPTIGGCLAANVHGKNNWVAGTLGEHVLEFDALLPNGNSLTCSPTQNKDYFEAMIGSMGLLGIFTSITLQMKTIQSGDLSVLAWTKPDLESLLESLDGNKTADYIVGWMDSTATAKRLGRGQIHRAEYQNAREDEDPSRSLRIDHQNLPDRFMGILPNAMLPKLMRPLTNNAGTKLVNFGKYWMSRIYDQNSRFHEPLVAFSFLLDFIPNWERAYGNGGLIQYQSFLPKADALAAYRDMLSLTHKRRFPAYLGVLKRHRPDRFLISHAVDGYSLALDFRVTKSSKEELLRLTAELDEIVLAARGRFYFAKDSTLNAEKVKRFLGKKVVDRFIELKGEADPNNLLQSDLFRRCFVN